MARITVEDCLENVDNRFQLVLMASKRARQIARGSDPRVSWENDKPTVLALREIAEGKTGVEVLDEPLTEENEFEFEAVEPPRGESEGGVKENAEPKSEEPQLPEGSEGASI